MEILDKDIAFLNAEVLYRNEIKYIVKINEKSVYLSEKKNFLEKWKETKNITWKDFCKKNNAIMVKYSDNIEIKKDEISKGNNFIKQKTKNKRFLNNYFEKQIKDLYKKFIKGFRNYSFPIENTKKTIVIIKFFNEQALIRCDNDYFFYDIELDEYTFYKKVNQKRKTKEIPWPRQKKEEIYEKKRKIS